MQLTPPRSVPGAIATQKQIHDAAPLYVRDRGGLKADLKRALEILAGLNPGPKPEVSPYLGRKINPKQQGITAIRKPSSDAVEISFPGQSKKDRIVAVHLLDPSGSKVIASGRQTRPGTFEFNNINSIEKKFDLNLCKVLVENKTLLGEARNKLRPFGFGVINTPDFLNGMLANNYNFDLGSVL